MQSAGGTRATGRPGLLPAPCGRRRSGLRAGGTEGQRGRERRGGNKGTRGHMGGGCVFALFFCGPLSPSRPSNISCVTIASLPRDALRCGAWRISASDTQSAFGAGRPGSAQSSHRDVRASAADASSKAGRPGPGGRRNGPEAWWAGLVLRSMPSHDTTSISSSSHGSARTSTPSSHCQLRCA